MIVNGECSTYLVNSSVNDECAESRGESRGDVDILICVS